VTLQSGINVVVQGWKPSSSGPATLGSLDWKAASAPRKIRAKEAFVKKSLIGSGLVAAMLLAGCATPPPAATSTPSSSTSASNFLACMVSDEGGFDDKSFNETSYKGLKDAESQLGIQIRRSCRVQTIADYAANVQKMVDAKCNIIVTVGFALGDATEAARPRPTRHRLRDRRLLATRTGPTRPTPRA
jgi:hypothetical protein